MRKAVILALLALASSGVALAQTPEPGATPYDVKEITFDSWCQNTQRYSADRCQARRAEDVMAFENYRGTVEHYEFDYLKKEQKDQEIQNLTNRDPTANVSGKLDATP
jgi:hypothetical protein